MLGNIGGGDRQDRAGAFQHPTPMEKQIHEASEELGATRRRQDETRKSLVDLREALDGLRESDDTAGKNMTIAVRHRDQTGQNLAELRRALSKAETRKKDLETRLQDAQGEAGCRSVHGGLPSRPGAVVTAAVADHRHLEALCCQCLGSQGRQYLQEEIPALVGRDDHRDLGRHWT